MMKRALSLAVMMAALGFLAGCGHKDLTAPCDRDSDGGWFSGCGHLRPVNSWAGRMLPALRFDGG